jgi:cobalt-zinc-cadmium efflux system outer membrane protein
MRMTRILLTILFALSLCEAVAVAQVTPPPKPLSVSEAVRLAAQYSATVRQSDAKVTGAEARVRGAGALPNPAISLAQPFGQNTGGLDEDIIIAQTVELGDKRRQRVYAAKAERDAALAERTGTSVDLAYNVRAAYYDAARAESDRNLASDALKNAQAFAQAAETQFTAGDVPRSNVVRSQIELSRAEQTLATAEADRATRIATLLSLTGLPQDTPVTLTDALTTPTVKYDLPALRSLALKQRPDLISARLTRQAREAALHGARAASQPDFFVEARHSTLDPTIGGNSLRIGITLPLADFGRNKADASAASAAVKEQQALLDETTRTALLDVETAYRNMEQARKAVDSFQAGRLNRSKELLDMARTGYENGANSFLELLDAQQVYRTEQTDYTRALTAYNTALAALERAVGGKLP